MTEARRDGCIVGPRVVHYFIGLVWLVTFVSLILCKALIVM